MISLNDLQESLGQLLAKTSETDIKNVIGYYDQSASAKENIQRIVNNFSRDSLKDTCTFLKSIGQDYPAQAMNISPASRNKDQYASDIVKFIQYLKPVQCLACSTNYVATTEDFDEANPKCNLCKRPSHSVCYKDKSINPEIGIIFICSECLSAKVALELNVQPTDPQPQPPKQPDTAAAKDAEIQDQHNEPSEPKTVDPNQEEKDCPLYLKRQCPHGLTGKRHIEGKPCNFKHRKRCMYHMEHGPSGCRFGTKCRYLHPPYCPNSIKLKMCLNRNCKELHMKGTQRSSRSLQTTQQTIPTSNRFPSWMADNQHENNDHFPQSKTTPDRVNPWNAKNKLSPVNKQPHNTDPNTSRDFLERHLEEMKSDLMSFIRSSIKPMVSNIPHQYVMMPPTNLPQQVPVQQTAATAENWSNIQINAQPAPQIENAQTNLPQLSSNYYQQYPTMQQAAQLGAR